jgi:hypothetical protein
MRTIGLMIGYTQGVIGVENIDVTHRTRPRE